MMKNLFLLFLASLSFAFTSDDCPDSIYFTEGKVLKYATYNDKDKIISSSISEVRAVKDVNGVWTSTVSTKSFDKKEKEIMDMDYDYECRDNMVVIDIISMLNNTFTQQQTISKTEFTGDGVFEFPAIIKEGTTFEDQHLNMSYSIEGNPMNMLMVLEVKNRKVNGNKTISTEAGTFPCFVFEQDFEVTMKLEGMEIPSTKFQLLQYYNTENGLIRTESETVKGKLKNRTDLISIN